MSHSICPTVHVLNNYFSPLLFSIGISICAGEKWYKHHLTYRIVNWPRHLSPGPVQLAVGAAFQLWSNVSGLAFQEVPEGPTDIRLAFYEGEHNDGASNAFDGPGQDLIFTQLYHLIFYLHSSHKVNKELDKT